LDLVEREDLAPQLQAQGIILDAVLEHLRACNSKDSPNLDLDMGVIDNFIGPTLGEPQRGNCQNPLV
jgi:hypothetical protein